MRLVVRGEPARRRPSGPRRQRAVLYPHEIAKLDLARQWRRLGRPLSARPVLAVVSIPDQRDVRTASGIVFDTHDLAIARFFALEIDNAEPAPVPATHEAVDDLAGGRAAPALAAERVGEVAQRRAGVEVRVVRLDRVTDALQGRVSVIRARYFQRPGGEELTGVIGFFFPAYLTMSTIDWVFSCGGPSRNMLGMLLVEWTLLLSTVA